MLPGMEAEIDAWIERQTEPVSKPEAIRQLVAEALKANRADPEPPRGNVQVASAEVLKRKRP